MYGNRLSRVPDEVAWALNEFKTDRNIIGGCQFCHENAPLSDWNLFYLDSYSEGSEDIVGALRALPLEAKKRFSDFKAASTTELMKRPIRVVLGQIAEQVAPGLESFPYESADCRSVFKPIDYIVFDGLTGGKVEAVHFVEVKTGKAKLNKREKQIQEVIEGRNVRFGTY